MTNTQFYVAIGVPFLTLLLMYIVTTVSNRASIQDLRAANKESTEGLRAEMRAGFSDLRRDLGSRMERIENRMDRIENRMDRIEKRLDVIDTEIRVSHHKRLAGLEARVLGRVS